MHHIQRKILNQLMHAASLGYAKLRPAGVESNHFAYHLDQLIRAGLIAKEGRSYFLTAKGLSLADRVSHENMVVRTQPHIVTSIHLTNGDGKLLVYKHTFQPYMNLCGFPQGRLHFEEHVAEAAERELAEKAGLTDITLAHRGMAYVHTTKEGTTIGKLLAHVFSGTVAGMPALAKPSQKGSCAWSDADKLAPAECMPGFHEIRKLLAENTGLFFAEIETEMA